MGASQTAAAPAAPASPASALVIRARSVRARVLLPLVISIFALLTIFVTQFQHDQKARALEGVTRAANSVEQMIKVQLDDDAALMSSTIEAIRCDERVAVALAEGDRQKLLKLGEPILHSLREHNRITHLYFHRPDRTNLLRVHRPEQHDDPIERFTLKEAERTGHPQWGNEQGPFGTLTLRVVYPWRNQQGKLIGYIELGKEVEDVLL